jgi:hypothetical protein
MAKDAEHFFMYLLAICSSLENCLFNLFSHLLIRLFFWCLEHTYFLILLFIFF